MSWKIEVSEIKKRLRLIQQMGGKDKIKRQHDAGRTTVRERILSLLDKNIIIAGSAVLDKTLSEFAIENNLSGFEFLSCIPGTIGGGIRMNAGCFGIEFKDILLSIQAINKIGNLLTIPSNEINFDYRNNDLPEDLIFLSASFKGVKSDYSLSLIHI